MQPRRGPTREMSSVRRKTKIFLQLVGSFFEAVAVATRLAELIGVARQLPTSHPGEIVLLELRNSLISRTHRKTQVHQRGLDAAVLDKYLPITLSNTGLSLTRDKIETFINVSLPLPSTSARLQAGGHGLIKWQSFQPLLRVGTFGCAVHDARATRVQIGCLKQRALERAGAAPTRGAAA